jgi:hypothetical protein
LITVAFLVFPLSWGWSLIIFLLPCVIILLAIRQFPHQPFWWYVCLGVGLFAVLDPSEAFFYKHSNIVFLAVLANLQTIGLIIFAFVQAILLLNISSSVRNIPIPSTRSRHK